MVLLKCHWFQNWLTFEASCSTIRFARSMKETGDICYILSMFPYCWYFHYISVPGEVRQVVAPRLSVRVDVGDHVLTLPAHYQLRVVFEVVYLDNNSL